MLGKVETSQLSVSYDAMINIARLDEPKLQEELVDAVLAGATARDIRSRIGEHKGRPKKAPSESSSTPKPKRVFHTKHRATVIVQAETTRLTNADALAALKEAFEQASDVA
jgi:hypothetical protein